MKHDAEPCIECCPLCNGTHLEDSSRFRSPIWDLVYCQSCEDSFVSPLPSQELLARYYRFETYAEPLSLSESKHNRARIQAMAALLARVEKSGAKRGRLLDVGCSTGHMLAAALQQGWQPEGIEIDPVTAAVTAKRFGLRVRTSPGLECLGDRDAYNLIVMSHWLEHTRFPGQQLEIAAQHLEPGGMILVRVPNAGSIVPRALGSAWKWFQPPVHLHYFTARSMLKKAEQVGLRVEWVQVRQGDALPMPFEIAAALARKARTSLGERRRARGPPDPESLPQPNPRGWVRFTSVVRPVADLLSQYNPLSGLEDSELVVLMSRTAAASDARST